MGTGSNSRFAAIGVTLLLSTMCSSVARADEAAEVAARAEALYFEGRELAESNNYAEALTRFEESLRLRDYPKTVLYIVECEAKLGRRIHAARQLVAVFPRLGGQTKLRRIAELERDEVFRQIGRLEVRLRRAAAGVTVAVDGVPWAPDDKGALFVEPGAHRIVMRQPGHVSREFTVQIAAGERFVREEEPLPLAPAADHRIIGWSLTTVGRVAALVSLVSLANVIAMRNDLDARCPPTQLNPCGGDPEVRAADVRMGTLIGTAIGFGVLGVVGLTSGSIVLVRISSPGPSVSRVPQVNRFDLGVRVAF